MLFTAMVESGVPKEGGPIGVMLVEHDKGRGFVKGMSEAAAKYKAGDVKAMPKIVENARGYIYNIADMHLSEEKQEELLEGFEKVEEERIGKGKHEEFHKLLHELKEVYLG